MTKRMKENILKIKNECETMHPHCNMCRYFKSGNEICKIREVNKVFPKDWDINNENECEEIAIEIKRAKIINQINK